MTWDYAVSMTAGGFVVALLTIFMAGLLLGFAGLVRRLIG